MPESVEAQLRALTRAWLESRQEGHTQDVLADLAAMSQSDISRFVSKKKPMKLRLETAERLARALGHPLLLSGLDRESSS